MLMQLKNLVRLQRLTRKSYKEYGVSFSICQVEDCSFVSFYNRKDELFQEMKKIASQEKLDFFGMLVTNVVSGSSLLLTVGKERLIEGLPYTSTDRKHLFDLPGILSRKKQLLPELLDFFKDNA